MRGRLQILGRGWGGGGRKGSPSPLCVGPVSAIQGYSLPPPQVRARHSFHRWCIDDPPSLPDQNLPHPTSPHTDLPPPQVRARHSFHRWCIGNRPGEADFRTYRAVLSELKHARVDVLKVSYFRACCAWALLVSYFRAHSA